MLCSGCGAENRPGRRFCSKCGAALAVACPSCAFANDLGDEFCGGCGKRLALIPVEPPRGIAAPPPAVGTQPATAVASPPPHAERRQLTVTFCDLVGSTALSGRLDPEELREHVRAYQAASAEVIARFDGHIAQYLGDGLLVYFGYPAAHEDDAQRAVRAGLAIVDAVGALNARQPTGGVRLAVRVGIHTGLVVVGEVGGGIRREQLALGETPNIAARLEALAEPDTVVISAATHRLVERFFACRDLGPLPLRGVATAQAIYQVLGERGVAARADGVAAPTPTRLVGREREIALVLERWEAAAEGLGQVVLLTGEAGIGKTRLTQAVCERLAGVAQARVESRCSPYRQHSPMHVVVELLQRMLGFERDDTPEMLIRRLEQMLAECGLPPAEAVPLLASLAHHFTDAGLAAEAIPYWQRAGENAVRRSANAEAITHFERGLALVPALADTPERAQRELALLMALGAVLYGSRGFAAPETGRVYARAQELCDQLGGTPEVFPALWGQWGFFTYQGNVQRALEIGEQLLALARRSGDTTLLLEAHHAMWPTRYHRGEPAAALEHFEEGRALYDPERHRSLAFVYGGHDAGVCGLMFEAQARWVLGYTQQALARGQQALELARQLNHPHSAAVAHLWVAVVRLLRGDVEAARTEAEAGQAMSAEYGFPQWSAMAAVLRGSALARVGEIETGLTEMRRGLAEWRATQAGLYLPMFLTFIAEAELARGEVEAGLLAVDEALARVGVHGERTFEAELHRLRGELLLARGAPDAAGAEAYFTRAIEVAREQSARSWELRAASSLGRLWQRQGRREDAHRLLAETAAWFTEGFDTGDVRGARELLAQLVA